MELKFNAFKQAARSFSELIAIDLEDLKARLDPKIIDGLENGMIQKFEYTTELCWKTIRKVLKDKEGIEAKTPKQAIKEFYLAGHVKEDLYLKLMEMIDARNRLSHIYNEQEFKTICGRFKEYQEIFQTVVSVLDNLLRSRP